MSENMRILEHSQLVKLQVGTVIRATSKDSNNESVLHGEVRYPIESYETGVWVNIEGAGTVVELGFQYWDISAELTEPPLVDTVVRLEEIGTLYHKVKDDVWRAFTGGGHSTWNDLLHWTPVVVYNPLND